MSTYLLPALLLRGYMWILLCIYIYLYVLYVYMTHTHKTRRYRRGLEENK